ncbi:MAG: S9 family peptidase [Chromatiales bacterium]|nr:S9 family peptidase [Chromatiales bacterium]
MTAPSTKPFGTWTSPITAARVAAGGLRLSTPRAAGGVIYWLEGRASEGGRGVVVARGPDGATRDLTPPPHDVRSRVHEYGGGAFAVSGRTVYFVDDADRRVHRLDGDGAPRPLTEPEAGTRYGGLEADPARDRVLAVRERMLAGDDEPTNDLVAIDGRSGAVTVLAQGHDFFASPVASPDGKHLAWLTWDHPDMPWDASTLWMANLDLDGATRQPRVVAGGGEVSVYQPFWSADGTLWFAADADGWWNLHRLGANGPERVAPMEAEVGRPQWTLGPRVAVDDGAGGVLVAACSGGTWRLLHLPAGADAAEVIESSLVDVQDLCLDGERLVVLGGTAEAGSGVWSVDRDGAPPRLLRAASSVEVPAAICSRAEPMCFPTSGGEVAHGMFYPPRNDAFVGPPGVLPPLLVMGHGGPTGCASAALDPRVQFWTSRGIAVLDVNYRGSSGFGRPYRRALDGRWGVADVEDCVHGARHLAALGRVDGERLVIRGGSAGGYTTLAALTFHDAFAAGASYYGISDLEALARDTHKFESRYLDRLVGPWPECADVYRERSPIHHVERLSCPVIFFQGLEDRVVPPDQAERMVEALREKGITVEYHAFEGEQHGFRKAETVRTALEAELAFYARVLGFEVGD